MDQSPFLMMKAFETQLSSVLSAFDVASLPKAEQRVVNGLKHDIIDARLDVRDYELSETREEQLKNMKQAKKRLEKIRAGILAASEYNVFTAVDVAQLAALAEQISENVR